MTKEKIFGDYLASLRQIERDNITVDNAKVINLIIDKIIENKCTLLGLAPTTQKEYNTFINNVFKLCVIPHHEAEKEKVEKFLASHTASLDLVSIESLSVNLIE